jgi:lipopolysaccharide biosynthesis glycosyltransferase
VTRRTVPLHLATATNRAYLPWCATALLSAVRTTVTDAAVNVHLIRDDDVSAADERLLRDMVESLGAEIDFHPVDYDRLATLPPSVAAHGGAVSCARLILAETLSDVDVCVYLDADTLTVDSLAPMASLPAPDVPLAAVLNVVAPYMRRRLHDLGLTEPLRYLNSGVLVMNLDLLRRHGAAEELLSYVRTNADSLLWVDQDALNAVFAGAWHELHPRWNAQNSFWNWSGWAAETLGADRLAEATSDPGILHFEGPTLAKPWHYLSGHVYRHDFRAALSATPWSGLPLEDRTLATRLLVHLPWERRLSAYLRLIEVRRKRDAVVSAALRRERRG